MQHSVIAPEKARSRGVKSSSRLAVFRVGYACLDIGCGRKLRVLVRK